MFQPNPFPDRPGTWIAAVALALSAAGSAQALDTTTVTLDVDFESPTFTPGWVTTYQYATGQGGWGGWNAVAVAGSIVWPTITSAQAHSGSQSMLTTHDTRVISKALDASQGDYPDNAAPFSINAAVKWWVQAWVNINPGGTALLTLSNGLGGCPLIQIGVNDQPYVNSCLAHAPGEASLGPVAHGQWLFLQMAHTDTSTQEIQFSISGQGIAYSRTLAPYSGPGSGQPNFLGVSGDAYWDDIRAGHGDAPSPLTSPVPEPASLPMLTAGLLGLGLARQLSGSRARG